MLQLLALGREGKEPSRCLVRGFLLELLALARKASFCVGRGLVSATPLTKHRCVCVDLVNAREREKGPDGLGVGAHGLGTMPGRRFTRFKSQDLHSTQDLHVSKNKPLNSLSLTHTRPSLRSPGSAPIPSPIPILRVRVVCTRCEHVNRLSILSLSLPTPSLQSSRPPFLSHPRPIHGGARQASRGRNPHTLASTAKSSTRAPMGCRHSGHAVTDEEAHSAGTLGIQLRSQPASGSLQTCLRVVSRVVQLTTRFGGRLSTGVQAAFRGGCGNSQEIWVAIGTATYSSLR